MLRSAHSFGCRRIGYCAVSNTSAEDCCGGKGECNCRHSIEFLLNGKKIVLEQGEFNPIQSLGKWLRTDKVNLKGTKVSCEEGGCGSCTVVMTQYDSINDSLVHRPINSCLIPMGLLDGQSITTIEHLGSKEKGLHPIQKSFVKHHATQCGYCTPGFIMNAYSMLLDKKQPSLEDLQNRFEGNICRCTGYRAIHDALRVFSKDYKENPDSELVSDETNTKTYICPDPSQPLDTRLRTPIRLDYKNIKFFVPNDFQQLMKIKMSYPNSVLIAGATEIGIDIKNKPPAPVYISLQNIKELRGLEISPDGNKITFGATTRLQDILDFCRAIAPTLPQHKARFFEQLAERLQTFGSTQIRNSATMVGNIACGGAVTDLSNFLIANQAIVSYVDPSVANQEQTIGMDTFYKGNKSINLSPTSIITKVEMPLPSENEYMFVHKQAYRRDDDICICSATMKVKIDPSTNRIDDIQLAYSGLSAIPRNAKQAEKFLLKKSFTLENIQQAYPYITRDFPIEDQTIGGHNEFRRQLMHSFLFRFYHQVEKARGRPFDKSATDTIAREHSKFGIKTEITSNGCKCNRQHDTMTVAKPVHVNNAEKLTTGEIEFTQDLPMPARGLHGAMVMSTIPRGRIVKTDYSKCFDIPGVVDVITYKDVKGQNLVGDVIEDEPVYAENEVSFVGQTIALVVAETEEAAIEASKRAIVEYEEIDPVLNIPDAINKNSYFDVHHKIQKGDVNKGFNECKYVIEGEAEIGGQEQLYLETQNCIVEPVDGDQLRVISSTQAPSTNQVQVAKANNMKYADVTVEVRQIGGGFGGKETQATMHSNVASVAVRKLRRPVRISIDRKTDLEITGKRHPILCKYKVGFNDDGKIISLRSDLYADCGWSVDISIAVTDRALFHMDGSYSIPNFYTECHMCKTNLPSNTAFRGFGAPQAAFFADEIIDQIAHKLNKTPEQIKEINLYKEGDTTHFGAPLIDNKLRQCWDYIKSSFDFDKKRQEIAEFNRNNKYKKRGIAMVPLKFGISFTFGPLNQAGCLVNIYKDGSVLASHSGVDMGQGLNTKLAQIVASTLRVPIESVRIDTTATNKVPNTSPTAASSGTDLNGWALFNACTELNQRLEKYRTPNRTFAKAVVAAYLDKVDLSAHGFYATPNIIWNWDTGKGRPFAYYTYGAGAAQVEIDLLTGDHVVNRADIVYDVGRSINPAIDIGQIEGGFLQGYGLVTMEELIRGDNYRNKWVKPGYLHSNRIAYYKVPGFNDIPTEFNVSILPGSKNKQGVYSSKAIGEPPLLLANCVALAIKDAIKSSRSENGLDKTFELRYPLTSDKIKVLSGARI